MSESQVEPSKDSLGDLLTSLMQTEFKAASVELETYVSGNVGGALVWQGFENLDQVARQNALWNVLRRSLDMSEQRRVAPIITVTPDEWKVLTAEEADTADLAPV